MNNVLFLDIDGVIRLDSDDFDVLSIINLVKLINLYQLKIVLISSEQGYGTIKQRNELINKFKPFGICNIDFIDPNLEATFCGKNISCRVIGIIDYLVNNNVNNYVILDDDFFNLYHLVGLNYYKINRHNGIDNNVYNSIILKPNNIDYSILNYKHRDATKREYENDRLIKVLKKVLVNKKGKN